MEARFFYLGIFALLGGVAVATTSNWSISYVLLVGVIGVGLVGVEYITTRNWRVGHAGLCGLLLVAGVLGWWRGDMAVQQFATSPLASQVGQTVTFTGLVAREPDVRETSTQLHIRLPNAPDMVLVTTDRYATVQYGDTVMVAGTLSAPDAFVTDYGRTFLYPEYLKAKGLQYRVSFGTIEVIATGGGNFIVRQLLAMKAHFVTTLGTVLPDPQAGLGVGLLLGVKQALGAELETAFRKTGIIHIVVLSGYNVMLVVAFVMFFLAILLPFRWRLVTGIVAITLFALLVGLSATVVRASIMASLFLLAPLFGRQYHLMRALFVAGVIMVLVNPYILLYDVGFQLSFLATLGLIIVAPQFELLLMKTPGLIKARQFFIATLATQVAVAPLLLYQIGEISIIALVVNVLVLPMVGVAMLLTFLTGLAAMVYEPLAFVLALPTYWVLSYIITMAEWFATVPYATIALPPFSVWWLAGAYMGLGAWWALKLRTTHLEKETSVVNSGQADQLLPFATSSQSAEDTSYEIDGDVWTVELEDSVRVAILQTQTHATLSDTERPIFFR